MSATNCRFCSRPLTQTVVDLGLTPLCETLISEAELNRGEPFYPLVAQICDNCYLVQVPEIVAASEIFSADYPYFSSFSDSWIAHGRRYSREIVDELGIGPASLVVEIASNDGYLLQHFREQGIPVLGIEPCSNVARAAEEKGIPTIQRFFGCETAEDIVASHGKPDLLIGNNVLAHVPDINDFVGGMKRLLAAQGRITMEFPHLMKLMEQCQFDTIYHEHFSYLSLGTVQRIFSHHGLTVFHVEEITTHGGSLRIHAAHDQAAPATTTAVERVLAAEQRFGLFDLARYRSFGDQVARTKRDILKFLIAQKEAGNTVAGYGAPGKGTTLLNYCGIRTDLLSFTVDRNPRKHGCYTPGTRIPIFAPEHIRQAKPDFLFILPWNLADEIMASTSYIREWGGRWVVPIPQVRVVD